MQKILKSWWTTALVAVLLTIGCGWQAPPLFGGTLTVNLTFTYSATQSIDASGNYPACSTTVTTSCVTGFDIYDNTSGSAVLVGTMSNAASPSGTQTVVQSFTLNNPTYGTHTIYATTAYLDSSGTAMQSGPSAPASFVVPAPGSKPPAAITATYK